MTEVTLRLPGFVNAHSHAFQRMLRGRVERVDPAHPHDDFWTWREAMYARRELDRSRRRLRDRAACSTARWWRPGTRRSASSTTRTTVPAEPPMPTRNAMAKATVAAARDAGIEIVLLMCAYARAGAGKPPSEGPAPASAIPT